MRQLFPHILLQLQQALLEKWQIIPQVQIQRFIQYLQKRIATVLQVKGGHTR